jgi:hypothetical protein
MRRLLLLCALLLGFTVPALAQTQAQPQAGPSGTYRGQVTSGGALAPSTLTFLPERHGGCYHIVDVSSGPYDGMLSAGEALGGDRHRFVWTDKFGTGTVIFAFKEGGTGFSDKWYVADRLAGIWLGKRVADDGIGCKPAPVASAD